MGTGAESGTGTRMERGGERRRALVSATAERSREEDQTHYLCRQEVAHAGSQQLPTQDPAPARRCGIEGRPGHQAREGGNDDGGGDEGGDGNETEDGNGHNDKDKGGNVSGNGEDIREEGGGKG